MIKHIWIEQTETTAFDPYQDSVDVLVETDDGALWAACFVTLPYLQRQMALSGEVAGQSRYMAQVRFVALETPHVIVENLLRDTIEDTIDNLMTLGTFESVFILHAEESFGPGSAARAIHPIRAVYQELRPHVRPS
jgi:hypothetical protein